jgi:hypothetical protein
MSYQLTEGDTIVVTTELPSAVVTSPNSSTTTVKISSSDVVTVDTSDSIRVETPEQLVVVSSGTQGPPGIPGDSINYVHMVAGQNLSGHRAVYTNNAGKLEYADKDIAISADRLVGITTGAANTDSIAEVQIVGLLEEPSWNWDISGLIYIGSSGILTQSIPSSGYYYSIAFPVTPTKIFINKQPPIVIG